MSTTPYPTATSWREHMPNATEWPPPHACPVRTDADSTNPDRFGLVTSAAGVGTPGLVSGITGVSWTLDRQWYANLERDAGFVLMFADMVQHWGRRAVQRALKVVKVQPAAKLQIVSFTRLERCMYGDHQLDAVERMTITPADRHALAQALAYLLRTQ